MSAPEPLLAASGAESLLGVLVMLGISFIGWVSNRLEAKRKAADGKPRTAPPVHRNAEDEQARKFLEALGLPQNPRAVPPPPLPAQPLRPTLRAPAGPPRGPAPPVAARSFSAPRPKPAVTVRRAAPPMAAASIETFENPHLPEMQVPEVPEFHTASSAVTAIPYETAVAAPASGPGSSGALQPAGAVTGVREMLRSSAGLRGALILREILGPPRSLQSGGFTHTFPSL